MSESEKKWFLIAGALNIPVFVVLNIYSCISAQSTFEAREFRFDHEGYSWGFPFSMYAYYTGYPSNDIGFTPGLVFNVLTLIVSIALTGMGLIFVAGRLDAIKSSNKHQ